MLELPSTVDGLSAPSRAALRQTLKISAGKALVLQVGAPEIRGEKILGVSALGQPRGKKLTGDAKGNIAFVAARSGSQIGAFTAAVVLGDSQGMTWSIQQKRQLVLSLPADAKDRVIEIVRFTGQSEADWKTFMQWIDERPSDGKADPAKLTHGGPLNWPGVMTDSGNPRQ